MNKSSFIQGKILDFMKENSSNKSKKDYIFTGNIFTPFPPSSRYVKEWTFRIQEKQFEDRSEFHPLFYVEDVSWECHTMGWHPLLVYHEKSKTGFETIEEAQEYIENFKEEENRKILLKEIIHEV